MMIKLIVYFVIFYHISFNSAVLQISQSNKKNIVIIGGGWAGFSTAYGILLATNAAGLDSSQVSVTILEGTPRPGGLASGWKSANGTQSFSSNNYSDSA
jgi:glycine/D-amino acid oxidase-like deaminating enzyme